MPSPKRKNSKSRRDKRRANWKLTVPGPVSYTHLKSMRYAIEETNRRRSIQQKYNEEHHIIPRTVQKRVKDLIDLTKVDEKPADYRGGKKQEISDDELYQQITETERDMKRAAKALEFEEAAMWRDRLAQLRQQWNERFGSCLLYTSRIPMSARYVWDFQAYCRC